MQLKRILKPFLKRYGKDREFYTLLDNIFGIFPNNIDLYKLALVHKSASVVLDNGSHINNERLEFLGDAVIEAVVSDFLFIEFPDSNEGVLTQIRSRIVSRVNLNKLAVRLGLDRYLMSVPTSSKVQKNIHGDAFEAIVGAIYLDQGYDFTNRLLINHVFPAHIDMDEILNTDPDYKSRIIEWSQKHREQINFECQNAEDHSELKPHFVATIKMNGTIYGTGDGNSKKEAEQKAACKAFDKINEGNNSAD